MNFKLVVGLGNPTVEYERTRHNAGFWFLDEIASRHKAIFRSESRFHGEVAKLELEREQVYLVKPSTYMNRSGLSVGAISRYYKITPPEILVVHDELDLPPGTVRLKRGGGHGGHNGLRDIAACLGTTDYYRLRLGIGHPGDRNQVIHYVLGAPSSSEQELIRSVMARALDLFPDMLAGHLGSVMNRLHTEEKKIKKS